MLFTVVSDLCAMLLCRCCLSPPWLCCRPSASRPGPGPRDKHGQQLNVNAAVGAAVSGAGKVAGAVGSIAVAGAKQLLTGLIPRPPGKVRS